MEQSHQSLPEQQQQQHVAAPPPPPPAPQPATGKKSRSQSADESQSARADSQSQQQQDVDDDSEAGKPPRKAQRRTSTNTAKDSQAAAHHSTSTSSDGGPPPGPPYICPACQTSYSRLEYLRRHERRHQDIRPFVCECGKSFSRSDVLSRHKRQCSYHLTGVPPSASPASDATTKKKGKQSGAKNGGGGSKKGRASAASSSANQNAGNDVSNEPTSAAAALAAAAAAAAGHQSSGNNHGSHTPPHESGTMMSHPGYAASTQPGPPPPLLPQSSGLPPPPPFYHQQHGGNASSSNGPNAGGSGGQQDASGNNSHNTDYSRTPGFMSAISHALNNFGSSHPHNYPPSPESNPSVNSRNSSPRLHFRDAIPYTQRSGSSAGNSRQSSLRKGTLDPYHPAAPWELADAANRSSPAPGTMSASASRQGSIYGGNAGRGSGGAGSNNNNNAGGSSGGSGGGLGGIPTSAPAFSYPANEFAGHSTSTSGSSGNSNQTLLASNDPNSSSGHSGSQGQSSSSSNARGQDTSRFASLSTGPLSPFSGMGLSSMSPYLSAFSNARDTPLVGSPGRAPGTPTSSLSTNVFDYTMRPPAKPASTTTPGKAGASMSERTGSGSGTTGTSAAVNAAIAGSKRKGDASSKEGEPTTPSASVAMSTSEGGSIPALTDFIDDQQRNAANGLLTLLGAGGAETPSRFVRSEAAGGTGSGGGGGANSSNNDASGNSSSRNQSDNSNSNANNSNNSMENNPGTTSANPSANPFFESAVTSGPEAFLLRLQGGEQDRRASMLEGNVGIGDAQGNSQTDRKNGGPDSDSTDTGASMAPSSGVPSSGIAGLDTPSLWDFSGIHGSSLSHGGSHSNLAGSITPGPGSVGWLLSPSVQALISSFGAGTTPGLPGEGGSYFPLSRRNSLLPPTPTPLADKATPSSNLAKASSKSPTGDKAETSGEGGSIGNVALERAFEDANNPFHIPKTMFRSCYSIPHWDLPPLTRLSVLAMHAQQNLLKHVPILHEPTFRLDTTPCCVAFAACMLGCHEAGRRWWAGEEVVPYSKGLAASAAGSERKQLGNDEKPSNTVNLTGESKAPLDEEDGHELIKPIVMTEKVDMLMKSFTGRAHSERDRVAVVQALMLSQTNNFLSSDATTRAIASISHGSVVSLARKAGLYDAEAKHVKRSIDYTGEDVVKTLSADNHELTFGFSYLPSYMPRCSDEEKVWRQWTEYESRRRTAFLTFLLDTVASLDAGLPTLVDIDAVKHLDLPVPDTLWRASDATSFMAVFKKYEGPTLDEALRDLLGGVTEDQVDEDPKNEAEGSGDKAEPKLTRISGHHGPFARLVMILPILRGIVHLLQARSEKRTEDKSPLEPWFAQASKEADGHHEGADMSLDASRDEGNIELFKVALSRWRAAWDADELCLHASSPAAQAKLDAQAKAQAEQAKDTVKGSPATVDVKVEGSGNQASLKLSSELPPSGSIFTAKTASGAVPLCEDALPFYWLSHVLLGHATSKAVVLTSRRASAEVASRRASAEAALPKKETDSDGDAADAARQAQAGDDNKVQSPQLPSAGAERKGSTTSMSASPPPPRKVPDFRSMLRFAKTFVNAGEGANGTTGSGALSLPTAASASSAS
ncbi:unnamed protein product [Jaminaea pallidilutea]